MTDVNRGDSLKTKVSYEPRRQASHVTGKAKKEVGTPLKVYVERENGFDELVRKYKR